MKQAKKSENLDDYKQEQNKHVEARMRLLHLCEEFTVVSDTLHDIKEAIQSERSNEL